MALLTGISTVPWLIKPVWGFLRSVPVCSRSHRTARTNGGAYLAGHLSPKQRITAADTVRSTHPMRCRVSLPATFPCLRAQGGRCRALRGLTTCDGEPRVADVELRVVVGHEDAAEDVDKEGGC